MNATHLIVCNRTLQTATDGAGGWIHIVPRGELKNAEAGIVQVLDEKAMDSILANIDADRQRLGERWPGIYAGREHFIYNAEQDSTALAWFKDFEKRSDGIWASADGLTDVGREAVQNRRYKFTSFVAARKDTEQLGGKRVRILKIDTVGFTNQANGKELLTPITNRQPEAGKEFRQGADAPRAGKQNEPKKQTMKSICTLLGLSEDAQEANVHAAVAKLLSRADISAPDLLALRNRSTELETKVTKLETEQLESDWKRVQNRFKPEEHAEKKKHLIANREVFMSLAEGLPVIGAPAAGRQQVMVLNRADGKTPETEVSQGAGDEQALAAKAEGETQQYMITNRCDYSTARNMVRMQKPELFGITRAAN